MEKSLVILLICLSTQVSFGQRFYDVAFDELPQNYQLYPRDEKNESIVPISGRIEIGGWSYISVVVYRNKKIYGYYKNLFSYDNAGKIGTFSLKPIIKAELAEYDFQVYASQVGKDSVLAFERKNIVSGDAYLIYGQSNGRAWEENYKYQNEYCRTFGFGSYQNGYSWGLSNSDYTGGFDGEQFIVGEWGIEFQRHIIENYGIPTCVINASTSGANIKTLSDRNPNNVSDINTHYGRLIYMAQKSGIINNIKSLFYWQAETDAAQIPSLWKPGFDQMYNFWSKDLPFVKKIYTFQIPLFGAGDYSDEVGVLRDYLRQLGSFYPKITAYAPLGVTGWNGWHFNLDGYKQIARELGTMVGKDFYAEKKSLFSPNIQKIYYSNANRDEITLAFESGQQMIYPKDTIAPNIGGGFGTYSLKDFFYLNKEWQKVASGKAEGNKIILKLKQPASATDSLIKYLPSIYPYSGGSFILREAPWIYIGPFLKNSDGMRAFAFHYLKIAPFNIFDNLNLTNTLNQGKRISLKWNNLANIKNYVLERISATDTTNIQLIIQLPSNTTSFSDTSVILGKEYIYRIKAVTDLQESNFSTLKIKTANDPSTLSVNSQINYYNSITINWTASMLNVLPDFYTIERKKDINGTFEQITKVLGNIFTYKDTTVNANALYFYRIKSSGGNNVVQGQVDVSTPALLISPNLISTVLNYNSIKLSWDLVKDATDYAIERSVKNGKFQQITKVINSILEWIDKDVMENTNYTYRMKALGNKTESPFKTNGVTTPALLTKPELSSTILFYNSLKITWKAISGAISYVLEKKTGMDGFKPLATLDGKTIEWLEKDLKENTAYTYRLKAFGDKTESVESSITATTSSVLATPEITADQVTHESVRLQWKTIPIAKKYVLERQAERETIFTKILETNSLIENIDTKLKSNQKYTYRLKAFSDVSESIFGLIEVKTLTILSNKNEENDTFTVYPNPSKDKLNISFLEHFTGNVSVVDLLGKNFEEVKFMKQKFISMDISGLKRGIYFVMIKNNEGIFSRKILVE